MSKALLAVFKALGIKPPAKPTAARLVARLSDETGMSEGHLRGMLSKQGINTRFIERLVVREATARDVKRVSDAELYNFGDYDSARDVPKHEYEDTLGYYRDYAGRIAPTGVYSTNPRGKRDARTAHLLVAEGKDLGVLGHVSVYDNTLDLMATHRMLRGAPEGKRNMLAKLLVLKAMQVVKRDGHGSVVGGPLSEGARRMFKSMGFSILSKKALDERRDLWHLDHDACEYKLRKRKP
jgi:hypothetical protein